MKRTLLITLTILLLCSAALAQKQPDHLRPDNLPEQVQRLEAEVRTLRTTVIRLQLTMQKAQVAQMESELQKIQAEKQKADQHEAGRLTQLQQVTEALSGAVLDADTRAEAEALRTSLSNPAPAHKGEALDRHEREVTAQLEREQKQWHLLVKQARALGIEPSSDRY